MDLSTLDIVVVFAITTIGAFVQGSVGFGLNLLVAPVLLLVDDRFLPAPAVLGGLVLTVLVTARDRKGLNLGEVKIALYGRIPATVLAAVVLVVVPEEPLSVLFAVLMLASVAIVGSGASLAITPRNLFIAGGLAGFMGTTTSIGGPPMAMLYANEEGARLRGTMSGFFVLGTVLTLFALLVTGNFGVADLGRAALLVPGIVVGFVGSRWGSRWLDRGRTRPAVLAVSGLAAVLVLLKTL